MLAILEPSIPAIEAATLLDRPADYLAKLRWASRKFQFKRTEADTEAISSIRRDKSLTPPQREDLIAAVFRSSRSAQENEWRGYRREARRWVRLVRAYEWDRDWLSRFDTRVRKAILLKIERDVQRASGRIVVPSKDMAERARRNNERRECRKQAKRQRRAFGWRGRSDGRTGWLTPMADGTYDPSEIARAEFAALTKWNATQDNHGVTLVKPEVVAKVPVKEMTEVERDEARLEALLRDEVKKFNRMRKKTNGTTN